MENLKIFNNLNFLNFFPFVRNKRGMKKNSKQNFLFTHFSLFFKNNSKNLAPKKKKLNIHCAYKRRLISKLQTENKKNVITVKILAKSVLVVAFSSLYSEPFGCFHGRHLVGSFTPRHGRVERGVVRKRGPRARLSTQWRMPHDVYVYERGELCGRGQTHTSVYIHTRKSKKKEKNGEREKRRRT